MPGPLDTLGPPIGLEQRTGAPTSAPDQGVQCCVQGVSPHGLRCSCCRRTSTRIFALTGCFDAATCTENRQAFADSRPSLAVLALPPFPRWLSLHGDMNRWQDGLEQQKKGDGPPSCVPCPIAHPIAPLPAFVPAWPCLATPYNHAAKWHGRHYACHGLCTSALRLTKASYSDPAYGNGCDCHTSLLMPC